VLCRTPSAAAVGLICHKKGILLWHLKKPQYQVVFNKRGTTPLSAALVGVRRCPVDPSRAQQCHRPILEPQATGLRILAHLHSTAPFPSKVRRKQFDKQKHQSILISLVTLSLSISQSTLVLVGLGAPLETKYPRSCINSTESHRSRH
jgi:hypothetical protein